MWRVKAFPVILLLQLAFHRIDCGNYLYFLSLDSPTYVYGDDGASSIIYIPGGFPFGGSSQYYLQVSSNGYIALGTSVPSSYRPMGKFSSVTAYSVVAPFAADVDASSGGSVSYQVYSSSQSATHASLVRQVSTFIQDKQLTYFSGTWMLVAYWNHVPHYRGSLTLTNSFQVVLITDGTTSFAVFSYGCNDMEWAHNATIGWQASSSYFRNHPLSNTANANLVACLNSPDHTAANVVFQLSNVSPCYVYQFGCFNGGCLSSSSYRCNGYPECTDGSDETACPVHCAEDQVRCKHDLFCVDSSTQCDSENDCHDGSPSSDEQNCGYDCGYNEFTCDHGRCLGNYLRCDGFPDCDDLTDEEGCPNCEFWCSNGLCILNADQCDGVDDCGDNSDEEDCSSTDSANVGVSVGVTVTLTLLVFVSLPVCIICIASCASWRKRRRVVSYSVPTSLSRHQTLVNYHMLQNESNENVENALLEAPPPYPGTDYTDDREPVLGLPPPEYSENPPSPPQDPAMDQENEHDQRPTDQSSSNQE